MLTQIVHFSLRYRVAVLVVATLLLLYGGYTAWHSKQDVFPDFVDPQVVIQTEAPGLAPEQVETLVTRAVEGAVSGIPNLRSVRSQSIQGLSIVTVLFDESANPFQSRQNIAEQLTAVFEQLPAGVKVPKLTPLTSSTMDLLKIGLLSDKKTPMELRTFADWTLRPRLQAVPGVATVGVMGGDVRQLQVQADPERLRAHGLGWEDVVTAARQAVTASGGGFVETENQRVILQAEAQSLSPADLAQTVISTERGVSVTLGDVATVAIGPEPKVGDVRIQGRP